MCLDRAEEDKFSPGKFVYVSHDGQVELLRMQLLSSMCPLNFYNFPLDAQTCNLTFGVLAHNSTFHSSGPFHLNFLTVSTFTVLSRNTHWCLSHDRDSFCMFSGFQVTVRRRALFYIVNLIVPSALLMLLDVMGFLLPPSNKQRLTYKATTFIGYFIFILMVFTLFPPFMGPLPLIGELTW
ncbi:5HT3A protein, partial [Polypterus senegalus]